MYQPLESRMYLLVYSPTRLFMQTSYQGLQLAPLQSNLKCHTLITFTMYHYTMHHVTKSSDERRNDTVLECAPNSCTDIYQNQKLNQFGLQTT